MVVQPGTTGRADRAADRAADPAAAPSGARSVAVPARTTTRRREITRQRLLDAALEVIAERGVASSVEDICERAGFTRGAFYSNFPNKGALLLALHDQEESRMLAHLDAALQGPADLDEAIEAGRRLLSSFAIDRRDFLMRSEFAVLALRDPAIAEAWLQSRRTFAARLARALEAAVAHAGRRLIVDGETAAETLRAVFEAAVRRALVEQADATVHADLAARLLPDLLRALTEPQGRGTAGGGAGPADTR